MNYKKRMIFSFVKITLMASTIFASKAAVRKSSSNIFVAAAELKSMLAITEAAPIISELYIEYNRFFMVLNYVDTGIPAYRYIYIPLVRGFTLLLYIKIFTNWLFFILMNYKLIIVIVAIMSYQICTSFHFSSIQRNVRCFQGKQRTK